MPFIGNKVADVAVTVGQGVIDASHIQDASITTADIGNDAITPNKVDDDGTGFQMGSLGLGTSVSGSEKLTVGGTASFSGDITGTLATAAQTNITSVGTLTSLTVDDMTFNGSTISDAGAFDIDAGGVIKLDAGGGQIQFFDDGVEIGVLENSSSDFVIESKVQDKDILFKGNDGGTGIELMRMNMSGANVGISTGNSIGAKLHVADNRSTAYSSTGEPAETIIAHNKNGTDNSGVNNYASLSFQVADGATSQGFLNYVRTGNNTGDFTFSQRTGSSSYAEAIRITSDGKVGIGTTSPTSLLYLEEDNTTNVTDAASMISNSSLTINGNSSDGSDVIRMGAMSNATGDYFIEVSNSAGNAAYSLLLNPINGGKVGIGTTNPVGRLDISQGGYTAGTQAIHFGADTGDNTSRTNSTTKYGVITGEHYSTSEEKIELITYYSSSSGTSLALGGAGNSAYNAPTEIGLRIASGTTVTSDNANTILTINGSGATIKQGYPLYAGRGATSGGRILAGHYGQANGDFLAVLSTHYSSGGFIVGYGVEGKENANGYVSTQDAFNGVRTAIQQDTSGIKFLTSAATQASPGTDITMTRRFYITSDGEFVHNVDRGGLTGAFVNDHSSTPYGIKIDFDSATPNNTNQYFITCQDSTNDKFVVSSNGDVESRSNSFGGFSDERLKENIVDATAKLDELNQVRVVNYNFKDDPDKKQLGVIGQELQEIFPKMVSEYGEDGYLGVKYSIFVPMLIKAVQELSAKVKKLENA